MTAAISQCEAEIIYRRPSTLGEGSIWDAESERLYWVDILEHRVFCFDPQTGSNREFDVGENVGTVVLTTNNKLLLALRSGLAVLDPKTRKLSALTDPRLSLEEGRFNDGKCDSEGRFWVGTMAEGSDSEGKAALYCLNTDLTTTRQLGDVTCSNGLCWSGDRRIFYYVDTPTYQVRAFDFDPVSGAIKNPHVAVELTHAEGAPDGMTIDAQGQLWIALFDGGKVLRVDPDTGARTYQVTVPGGGNVTSCAFGGKDLDQLYITTGRVGLSTEQKQTLPDAGSLFVANVPFRGVPAHRFAHDF